MIDTFFFDGLEKLNGFKLVKGITVIDIGAHHGMYSLKAVMRGADSVVAVEPNPANYSFLKSNMPKRKSIHLLNVAISNVSSDVNLFECRSSGGHTIKTDIRDGFSDTYTGRKITVKALTLDNLVGGLGISPNIIKIDTQGAELDILKGASQTLKKPNVKFVIDTHTPQLAIDVQRMLHEADFNICELDGTIYAHHQK
ncbi:MAG: FkbM family methyltransferase [Candidatus Bathyarchaeota archaeon]|nr:FkbM family methyltransferase [Candidatus Bathyarchaeota archaeon]